MALCWLLLSVRPLPAEEMIPMEAPQDKAPDGRSLPRLLEGRATEEVPGTSATGVDLPSGESGTDGESSGVMAGYVDDVKDGMEEITTGTTGAGENGTSHGTGDGTSGQTTGGGASGTAGGQ